MFNLAKNKGVNRNTTHSIHDNSENVITIDQQTANHIDNNNLTFRISGDHSFDNESLLSGSYYYNNNNINKDNENKTKSDFTEYLMNSNNKGDGDQHLHNFHLEYVSKKGIRVGGDYTIFKDANHNKFKDYIDQAKHNDFHNNSRQHIHRRLLYANYDYSFSKSWDISTGVNAGINNSKSDISYLYKEDDQYFENKDMHIYGKQNEIFTSFHLESNHEISEVLSFDVGFQIEYYNSDYTNNGIKKNLWNDWSLFPSFSIQYAFPNKNYLNLSLSSDKVYPSYWAINPQTTHTDSYMEITGNPYLKPSKVFDTNLMFMMKNKYSIMAFLTYRPDYFTQMPYQDKEKLKIIYQFHNFDYDLKFGIGTVIPFNIGKFWNSRFTINGINIRQKINNFNGSVIDRNKYAYVAFWNNTLRINSKVNFQINSVYQSKSIQGVYDLGHMCNINTALRWTASKNMYLLLEYRNIFKHSSPSPTIIDWGNQYSKRENKEYSNILLTISWNFGDYKQKRIQNIDTKRFQRQ
jgi:hypothetical protein